METVYFTPLIDFWSPEFGSYYISGLRYTIEPANCKLATAAKNWVAEGRIRMIDQAELAPERRRINGSGIVR